MRGGEDGGNDPEGRGGSAGADPTDAAEGTAGKAGRGDQRAPAVADPHRPDGAEGAEGAPERVAEGHAARAERTGPGAGGGRGNAVPGGLSAGDSPARGPITAGSSAVAGIAAAPGVAVGWAMSVDRSGPDSPHAASRTCAAAPADRTDPAGSTHARPDTTASATEPPAGHPSPPAAGPTPAVPDPDTRSAAERVSHTPDGGPAPSPRSSVPTVPTAAEALQAVATELSALAEHLRADGQSAESDIVAVTALIATDPALRALAEDLADGGLTPAEAVVAAANRHADALAALGDPLFADRAADVRHIGRRTAAILAGNDRREPVGDLVLLGDELAAADLLAPGRSPVAAVSARGGPTGHLAVVARSLGIPLVLGIAPEVLRGADGHRVLVDGGRGSIAVDPDVADIAPQFPVPDESPHPLPPRATRTRDGQRIRVGANIGSHREALAARQHGAEYVGLLRTELPFLGADHWPDADEHTAALVPLLRDGPAGPAVVRTLDFAADKRPAFAADDPAACRSDDVLRAQFAGILAAAATTAHPVHILLPMVADAVEFAHCRRLLADACRAAGTREPPLGAMVERESAVADAEALAAAADFLSVGTNDLTPALVGLPRHDPRLVPAMAGTPTVLRALQRVVAAGHAHDRTVSVCGDAAADPSVLPLLVGLGVDAVSVAPPALAAVRAQIAGLDVTRCTESARRRLAADH
ncbi:hypothetical protein GCM10023205_56080 [Yinghuangia aomiensis]|uniref:Phosphoenolpyruvate-protein phosphotransferase n=1 Tax=Yinghuangia aomiensis TaxID=676205 RepID=A0ABP9HVS8_9ACTN